MAAYASSSLAEIPPDPSNESNSNLPAAYCKIYSFKIKINLAHRRDSGVCGTT
jgi:hypothetical protein